MSKNEFNAEVKLTAEEKLIVLRDEMFKYFADKVEAAELTGSSQAVLDAKALLLESMKASGEYKKLNVNFDALIETYRNNAWPKKSDEEVAAELKEELKEMKAAEKAAEKVAVA